MRLIVAGGGTGGHLFPGIAVAEEFLARDPENQVLFVGARQGIEARVLPERGLPHRLLDVSGLKGLGLAARLRGLMRLPVALLRALGIVREFRPDIVLGVGGYASGPVLLGAWLARAYTAVQEQNSRAGLTNRVLGRLVRRVFLGFEGARSQFPAAKTAVTGNPVRSDIRAKAAQPSPLPAQPHVVILGGSQGARALNERLPEVWKKVAPQHPGLKWTHQCGRGNLDGVKAAYGAGAEGVTVAEFVSDMAALIQDATLVVGRAGASTVAELAALGRPALFVPFPAATDDHQTLNARDCVAAGGAVLVPQAEAAVERLASEVGRLLRSRTELERMGLAMRSFGKPDAAARIVDICLADLGRSAGAGGKGMTAGGRAA